MRALKPWHCFVISVVLAGGLFLFAWRPTPAVAMDPPPPSLYLPFISIPPPPIYLPLISVGLPVQPLSAGFFGVNGGPIDGGTGTGAFPGDLAYFPALRSKSFDWMNVAGIGWYRNYGSDSIVYSWRFVQPAANQYDWTFWDELVRQAQSHNISLLASIGDGVPAWANGSSDWRNPPSDLYAQPMESTAWYKYVHAFVDRYNGDGVNDMPGLIKPIKYWEFWNEADLREGWNPPVYAPHEFSGSLQDYMRLRAVGYAAVKAADPQAIVVGPATAQSPGNTSEWVGDPLVHWFLWTWNDFLAAGGMNTLDVVSFTHYFSANNWDIGGEVEWEMGRVDANRAGKPVWLTETGWQGSPTTGAEQKSRSLVRLTTMLWAEPFVQRVFWYDLQEQSLVASNTHRGLMQTRTGAGAAGLEPDPMFHPAFRGEELMHNVLSLFTTLDRPATLDVGGAARAYHFSSSGLDVWVAWLRAESGSTDINLDTGGRTTRVISMYGQDLGTFGGGTLTVGPDPVYLTTNLAWNQNVGRITGRVRDGAQPDASTNGVLGATVEISGPVNANSQTDADGNYVFSVLPEGAYHVSVPGFPASPPGYDVIVARDSAWGQTSFTVTVSAGR